MVLPKNRASSLTLLTSQLHPHRNSPSFQFISVFISISQNFLSLTQKKKKCSSLVLRRRHHCHRGSRHHHEISGILCPTNTPSSLTAQAVDLPVSANDSLHESPPSTSDAPLFLVQGSLLRPPLRRPLLPNLPPLAAANPTVLEFFWFLFPGSYHVFIFVCLFISFFFFFFSFFFLIF